MDGQLTRRMRIAALAAALAAPSGCNIIEGAGKDLENLGKGAASLAHDTNQAIDGAINGQPAKPAGSPSPAAPAPAR